jgi:hypothetical protein
MNTSLKLAEKCIVCVAQRTYLLCFRKIFSSHVSLAQSLRWSLFTCVIDRRSTLAETNFSSLLPLDLPKAITLHFPFCFRLRPIYIPFKRFLLLLMIGSSSRTTLLNVISQNFHCSSEKRRTCQLALAYSCIPFRVGYFVSNPLLCWTHCIWDCCRMEIKLTVHQPFVEFSLLQYWWNSSITRLLDPTVVALVYCPDP